MTHSALSVVLALISAFLFACGSVAQQSAAAEVPEGESLVSGLAGSLRWWIGLLGDAGGYAVQVAALWFGSVLVVQPLLVSMLLFALPLSARFSGTRVLPSTWAAAVALSGALVVFLVVGDPSEGRSTAPAGVWVLPLTVVAVLCGAAVVAAGRATRPSTRALLYGSAGGVLFGVSVVFTKAVTDQFAIGPAEVFTSWQIWALVATGAVGFALQQKAFQVGPLAASLPAVTIGEPLGAAALGVAVLGERLRTDGIGVLVVTVAVTVMIWAAVRLSRARSA